VWISSPAAPPGPVGGHERQRVAVVRHAGAHELRLVEGLVRRLSQQPGDGRGGVEAAQHLGACAGEAARVIAGGAYKLGEGFMGLHRQLGRVHVRPHRLAARPAIHLERPARTGQHACGLLVEQRVRLQPVEIQCAHLAGLEGGDGLPVGQRAVHGSVGADHHRVAGQQREVGVRAADDEGVVVLRVLEPQAAADLLEQAQREVEVRLVELHAVGPLLRGHRAAPADGRDVMLLEQHGQDVLHGLVLEDAAIAGAAQIPQARHRLEPVGGEAAPEGAEPVEGAHDAVKVARFDMPARDGAGDGLADELRGVDVHRLRDDFGAQLEGPADRLAHGKAAQRQRVRPERGRDLQEPRRLPDVQRLTQAGPPPQRAQA
jgi:hypothetical protein